ncbi:MAG: DUF357 domain-containing protein [Thermoplasmata archaeon]
MSQDLSNEKVSSYLKKTESALKKIKIAAPENSHLWKIAIDFLEMAKSYFSDANYFFTQGDLVNAFAAVNYAHGWIDAGARMGLFDVEKDHTLFTLAY